MDNKLNVLYKKCYKAIEKLDANLTKSQIKDIENDILDYTYTIENMQESIRYINKRITSHE